MSGDLSGGCGSQLASLSVPSNPDNETRCQHSTTCTSFSSTIVPSDDILTPTVAFMPDTEIAGGFFL